MDIFRQVRFEVRVMIYIAYVATRDSNLRPVQGFQKTHSIVEGLVVGLSHDLRPVWIAPSPTPLKINMEHNHGGLEDHFPF